jgi:hypothetical protein
MWNLVHYQKWRFSCPLKWSYKSPSPIMLTIEPITITIFLGHSPITFKQVFFWYPFLEAHLTNHILIKHKSRFSYNWSTKMIYIFSDVYWTSTGSILKLNRFVCKLTSGLVLPFIDDLAFLICVSQKSLINVFNLKQFCTKQP